MADLKNKRIRLESKIQRLLQHDNGVTSHFDYHIHMNSKKNTIELNLLTFNPVHDEYMLLNSVFGKSSIDCLEKMEAYLMQEKFDRTEKSFTISWQKSGDEGEHKSYFRGTSEEQVIQKFLHEKNPEEFEFSIKENPLT